MEPSAWAFDPESRRLRSPAIRLEGGIASGGGVRGRPARRVLSRIERRQQEAALATLWHTDLHRSKYCRQTAHREGIQPASQLCCNKICQHCPFPHKVRASREDLPPATNGLFDTAVSRCRLSPSFYFLFAQFRENAVYLTEMRQAKC